MLTNDDDPLLETYRREVGNEPLLTPEQEQDLARRRMDGDPEAAEILVRSNLRLVLSVARKYQGCGVDIIDLISEGNLGLIRVASEYEPRGTRFSTFAQFRINQSMCALLNTKSRTIRLPAHLVIIMNGLKRIISRLERELERDPTVDDIAAESGRSVAEVRMLLDLMRKPASLDKVLAMEDNDELALMDIIGDRSAASPDAELSRNAMRAEIERAVRGLPNAKQADIVMMRYGIGDYSRPHILQEVADKYGVTRERIRQIEAKAFRKLARNRIMQENAGRVAV